MGTDTRIEASDMMTVEVNHVEYGYSMAAILSKEQRSLFSKNKKDPLLKDRT